MSKSGKVSKAFFGSVFFLNINLLFNFFADGFENDSHENDVKDITQVPSYDTDEEDYSDYTDDGTTTDTG